MPAPITFVIPGVSADGSNSRRSRWGLPFGRAREGLRDCDGPARSGRPKRPNPSRSGRRRRRRRYCRRTFAVAPSGIPRGISWNRSTTRSSRAGERRSAQERCVCLPGCGGASKTQLPCLARRAASSATYRFRPFTLSPTSLRTKLLISLLRKSSRHSIPRSIQASISCSLTPLVHLRDAQNLLSLTAMKPR